MYFCLLLILSVCGDREKLIALLGKSEPHVALMQVDHQFQLVSGGGSAPPSRRRQDGQSHGPACEETDFNDSNDPDCYARRFDLLVQETLPQMKTASQHTFSVKDKFVEAQNLLNVVPVVPEVDAVLGMAIGGAASDLQFHTNAAMAAVRSIAADSQTRLGSMEKALDQDFSRSATGLATKIKDGQTRLSASILTGLNKLVNRANSLNTKSQSAFALTDKLQTSATAAAQQLRSATAEMDALIDKLLSASLASDASVFALQNSFGQKLVQSQTGAMQSANAISAQLKQAGASINANIRTSTQSLAKTVQQEQAGAVAKAATSWKDALSARVIATNKLITPISSGFAALKTSAVTAATSVDKAIAAALVAANSKNENDGAAMMSKVDSMTNLFQADIKKADAWSGSSATLLGQLTDKLTALKAQLVSTVAGSQKSGSSTVANAALVAMAKVGQIQAKINAELFAKQKSNLGALDALSTKLAKSGMNFQSLMDAASAIRNAIESSTKASVSGGVSVTDGLMAKLNEAVQKRSLALAALTDKAVHDFSAEATAAEKTINDRIQAEYKKAVALMGGTPSSGKLTPNELVLANIASADANIKATGVAAKRASALLANGVAQRQTDVNELADKLTVQIADGKRTATSMYNGLNAVLNVALGTSGIASSSASAVQGGAANVNSFVTSLQGDKSIDRLRSTAAGVGLEQTASKATSLVSNTAQLYSDTNNLVSSMWKSAGVTGSIDGIKLINPDVIETKLARLNSPLVTSQLNALDLRVTKIGPMPDMSVSTAEIIKVRSEWESIVKTLLLPQIAAKAQPVSRAVDTAALAAVQAESKAIIAKETNAVLALNRTIQQGISDISKSTSNATQTFKTVAATLASRPAAVAVDYSKQLTSTVNSYKTNTTVITAKFVADMASVRDQLSHLNPPNVSATLIARLSDMARAVLGNTSIGIDSLVNSSVEGTEEATRALAAQLLASLNANAANAELMSNGSVRALSAAAGAVDATLKLKAELSSIAAMNENINKNSAATAVKNLQTTQAGFTNVLMNAFSSIRTPDLGPAIHNLDIFKALVRTEISLTNYHADAQTEQALGGADILNRTLDLLQSDLVSTDVKLNNLALDAVHEVGTTVANIRIAQTDLDDSVRQQEAKENQVAKDISVGTTIPALDLSGINSFALSESAIQTILDNNSATLSASIAAIDKMIAAKNSTR